MRVPKAQGTTCEVWGVHAPPNAQLNVYLLQLKAAATLKGIVMKWLKEEGEVTHHTAAGMASKKALISTHCPEQHKLCHAGRRAHENHPCKPIRARTLHAGTRLQATTAPTMEVHVPKEGTARLQ